MAVCCEYCVLLGRGFCDELITGSEKSYRLRCVVVCDLENSSMRRLWRQKQTNKRTEVWKNFPLYLFNSNDDNKNNKDFILFVTVFAKYNYLKLRRLLAHWHCPRKRNYILILLTFLSSLLAKYIFSFFCVPVFILRSEVDCVLVSLFARDCSFRWVSVETSASYWERITCLNMWK